jgi:hypothetical protein
LPWPTSATCALRAFISGQLASGVGRGGRRRPVRSRRAGIAPARAGNDRGGRRHSGSCPAGAVEAGTRAAVLTAVMFGAWLDVMIDARWAHHRRGGLRRVGAAARAGLPSPASAATPSDITLWRRRSGNAESHAFAGLLREAPTGIEPVYTALQSGGGRRPRAAAPH